MQELIIDATVENLDRVNEFVHKTIAETDCTKKAVMQLDLIVEEIFVNIANYAYEATGLVKIVSEVSNGFISLTFIDSGIPYNPLDKADPDISLSAEDRNIGGLGIFLTKKLVEDISYKYVDGQNILQLSKSLKK